MAYKENAQSVTLEAGSDLSASQFAFVSLNASAQLALTGNGAQADGVLQSAPSAAGRAAEVDIGGITHVKCGGTVTKGGPVGSDAAGLAVDAASGDIILGTALETGANGSVIAMLFHPRGAA